MDYKELTAIIQSAYESSVTIQEAEKLAARFLHAQIEVSEQLRGADLDARMRKSGVKALKSAVRMEEVRKHEKKPTEGTLEDVVNTNEMVTQEQEALDKSEVDRDLLSNYLNIFKDAHIFFRGVSKGRFE